MPLELILVGGLIVIMLGIIGIFALAYNLSTRDKVERTLEDKDQSDWISEWNEKK